MVIVTPTKAASRNSSLVKDVFLPAIRKNRIISRPATRNLDPPWATSEAKHRLRDTFLSLRREGQIPVLVIDEAHCLKPPVLDELRMLTNFEMDTCPVFSLILSGHPELARNLARRGNEALAQRLTLRYHLIGLDREETKAYVAHHTKLAGVVRPVFTE